MYMLNYAEETIPFALLINSLVQDCGISCRCHQNHHHHHYHHHHHFHHHHIEFHIKFVPAGSVMKKDKITVSYLIISTKEVPWHMIPSYDSSSVVSNWDKMLSAGPSHSLWSRGLEGYVTKQSWHGNVFFITGLLWGESTYWCGFPTRRASNTDLWWFLCC